MLANRFCGDIVMVFSGKETGTLFPALPRMLFLHFQHPREGSSYPIPFPPGMAAAYPFCRRSTPCSRRFREALPAICAMQTCARHPERKKPDARENIRPGKKGIGNEESKPPRELRNIRSSLFNIYCRTQVFKPFDKKISIFIYFIDIPPFPVCRRRQWNYIDPANREDAAP